MGVAVRYKQEDPWERIRLMHKAMPTTPLQFLSTGFRFIAWETASPDFNPRAPGPSSGSTTASPDSGGPLRVLG